MRYFLWLVLAIVAVNAFGLFRVPGHCYAEAGKPEYAVYTLRTDGKLLGQVAADADDDGVKDILVLRAAGSSDVLKGNVIDVYLLKEEGLSSVPDDSILIGDQVGTVEVEDINGDGRADVCVISRRRVVAFLQKADGSFPNEGSEVLRYASIVPTSSKEPIFSRWIRDYNNDGTMDILLPGEGGLALFLGGAGGSFPQVPSQVLQAEFESQIARVGDHVLISHRLPEVTLEDIDGDNFEDLIAFDGTTLYSFVAMRDGTYSETPKRFKFPAAETDQSATSSALTDLSGDGALDVAVLRFTQGRNIHSEIMIFLGTYGFEFDDQPGQVFAREGQAIIPFFLDLNGDGRKEIVLSEVKVSMGFFVNYFLRHRIKMNVSVQCFGPDGKYSPEPDAKMTFFIKTLDSPNQPASGVGDFNGDGMEDFVVGLDPDRLTFFLGDEKRFLSGGPAPQVEVDSSGTMTVLKINADESDDIFIRRSGKGEEGTASVLISR